jgi:hypothetical protein
VRAKKIVAIGLIAAGIAVGGVYMASGKTIDGSDVPAVAPNAATAGNAGGSVTEDTGELRPAGQNGIPDVAVDEDGEPAAESDFSGDGLFDLEDEGDEGDEPAEGDSEPDAGLEFGEGLDPLSPDSPVDNSDTVPEVVIRPSAEFDVFDDAEGSPEDDLDDADGVS